jgi:hypothetical protein
LKGPITAKEEVLKIPADVCTVASAPPSVPETDAPERTCAMKRRHTLARSLLWLAMIFLFTGLLVASPAGRFFAIAGAGIMALTSLCLSPPGRRILAGSVATLPATGGTRPARPRRPRPPPAKPLRVRRPHPHRKGGYHTGIGLSSLEKEPL